MQEKFHYHGRVQTVSLTDFHIIETEKGNILWLKKNLLDI